jgi:hypothetical protein
MLLKLINDLMLIMLSFLRFDDYFQLRRTCNCLKKLIEDEKNKLLIDLVEV